jgi:hypothetical protein
VRRSLRTQSQIPKRKESGESDSSRNVWPTPSIYRKRTVTVKFFNLTVKGEGKTIIRMVFSGVGAVEDVFFRLDSRIVGFGGSSFWFRKRFAPEGLLLGDSESGLTKSTL